MTAPGFIAATVAALMSFGAAEGVGGYARPMPPEWMTRQAGIIHERCKSVDILITTALIPGRPAPNRFAVAIACRPATPTPRISTRAALTVPAAVMSMGMNLP
ncbi:MAG: hypothetical protein E6H64_10470 [Betaproteobacteria bacterium]|nr:MAG: hypothetical protein E6H64_10470 [Betaproteobacteria bacterium]